MLRKIKLYGELAKFVGHKEFEIKADTLAHAMSFLINNFPGIEQHMNDRYYKLKVAKPPVKATSPINAAPNNIFPTPLPAPAITGIKCISSCPMG